MCTHGVSVERLHGGKKNAEANAHDAGDIDDLPKEAMVSRYEEVRGNVIGCPGMGVFEGQGLALILHKGMTAWLRTWLKAAEAHSARPVKSLPAARPIEKENVKAQIVSIIATMALNNEQEPPYDTAR